MPMLYSVFVGHVAKDTTKEELTDLFEKVGKVMDVYIHSEPRYPHAYAFVRYGDISSVMKAVVELNRWPLHGFELRVELASECRSILRLASKGKSGAKGTTLKDCSVRSQIREACDEVNENLDYAGKASPLDSKWVLDCMSSARGGPSAKLTGVPTPECLASLQRMRKKLLSGLFLARDCEQSSPGEYDHAAPKKPHNRAASFFHALKAMTDDIQQYLEEHPHLITAASTETVELPYGSESRASQTEDATEMLHVIESEQCISPATPMVSHIRPSARQNPACQQIVADQSSVGSQRSCGSNISLTYNGAIDLVNQRQGSKTKLREPVARPTSSEPHNAQARVYCGRPTKDELDLPNRLKTQQQLLQPSEQALIEEDLDPPYLQNHKTSVSLKTAFSRSNISQSVPYNGPVGENVNEQSVPKTPAYQHATSLVKQVTSSGSCILPGRPPVNGTAQKSLLLMRDKLADEPQQAPRHSVIGSQTIPYNGPGPSYKVLNALSTSPEYRPQGPWLDSRQPCPNADAVRRRSDHSKENNATPSASKADKVQRRHKQPAGVRQANMGERSAPLPDSNVSVEPPLVVPEKLQGLFESQDCNSLSVGSREYVTMLRELGKANAKMLFTSPAHQLEETFDPISSDSGTESYEDRTQQGAGHKQLPVKSTVEMRNHPACCREVMIDGCPADRADAAHFGRSRKKLAEADSASIKDLGKTAALYSTGKRDSGKVAEFDCTRKKDSGKTTIFERAGKKDCKKTANVDSAWKRDLRRTGVVGIEGKKGLERSGETRTPMQNNTERLAGSSSIGEGPLRTSVPSLGRGRALEKLISHKF